MAGAVAGLTNTAIRTALGTISRRSPNRLELVSWGEEIDASHIAARPVKAGDETQLDRVLPGRKNNRDCRGRRFGRERSGSAAGRGDDGDAAADKISHDRGYALEAAVQPMVLDRDGLTLDVAGFIEAFTKLSTNVRGAFRRTSANESNHRHRRLLRARRHRPGGRGSAEQSNELASCRVDHGLPSGTR